MNLRKPPSHRPQLIIQHETLTEMYLQNPNPARAESLNPNQVHQVLDTQLQYPVPRMLVIQAEVQWVLDTQMPKFPVL